MIFKIIDRKISVESEVVLSYSLDYVATFEFDEEWNNKIVTARFVHENGNMVEVVLDSENSCNIPLFPKGIVNVGVYTDEFTSTYAPMRIYTSIKDIGEYEVIPPTADVYQQIISLIEEGRIKGEDGFSPIVDIEDIEGGHKVVITDADGDKEFDVMDGSDYIITESDYQAIADRVPIKVDDVQVNGTSIVADGVANVSTGLGLNTDANGKIQVKSAGPSLISNRDFNSFLPAGSIDNVVKYALTDGKGAEWTEAEKKAARQRIGEPQFELIEEITLTEDTKTLHFELGEFKKVLFVMYAPAVGTNTTVNIGFTSGGFQYLREQILKTTNTWHTFELEVTPLWVICAYARIGSTYYNGNSWNPGAIYKGMCFNSFNLNDVYISAESETNIFKSGTNIKIYGIRG